MVEFTIMMTLFFIVVLGGVDFLFAFYNYNAAVKAVELGARIAAVWDPVSKNLPSLSTAVLNNISTAQAGGSMPYFKIVCTATAADGNTGTCNCTDGGSGVCGLYSSGTGDYLPSAMQTLVWGRGNSGSCNPGGSVYTDGMCDVFAGITPLNVRVTYEQTGLGYAGRPGGPVPTITVQLINVPFKFYFLSGLLGFANITMPPLSTTITGEYMSSAQP